MSNAAIFAEREDFDPRVVRTLKAGITKAAVGAGTLQDGTWGGPLADIRDFSGEYLATLRSSSLFDSLLTGVRTVPINQRIAVTTQAAAATNTAEGTWKLVSKMAFDDFIGAPMHAVTETVLTRELLRFASPAAQTLIDAELRGAVAQACDTPVASALLNGVTPSVSSGNPRTDLATLLDAVPLKQTSRPMFFSSPNIVKQLAIAGAPSGAPSFPDVQIPGGGAVSGVPLVGCDIFDNYPTLGTLLVLVDSAACAADGGALFVEVFTQGSLQMTDSASGSGPLSTVSLWESGAGCVRSERFFNFQRLRQSAVAVVKGAAYAIGSP